MAESSGAEGPYSDDASIADDDYIYRRVGPDYWDTNRPNELGQPGFRSNAFQPWPQGRVVAEGLPGPAMSVGLDSELAERGMTPGTMLDGFGDGYGLARIEVSAVRATGMGLVRWPTAAEAWHAMVFSMQNPKFTKSEQRALRAAAEWVELPVTT